MKCHCWCCEDRTKKRPRKAKPSFKHWDFNKLLSHIRMYVDSVKDNEGWKNRFIAEDLSEQFKAKRRLIDKAIQIIKRDPPQGYYISELNHAMHDSNRDPTMCRGSERCSAWMPTVYYVWKKENLEECPTKQLSS
jgi:hypothetical protein